MTNKLQDLLTALNSEQRKCVENLDGKFLVLAGPGTGKTYTVIKRLQAMILSGVKPERILCMTYSRAAADEMKRRVIQELDENNNNIEIHTFHSFCNKLIGEYPDEFDVPDNVVLIPDSIKVAFLKECIDTMTGAQYYKSDKANKYSCLDSIQQGIGWLKKFRVTDKNSVTLEENLKTDPDWFPAIKNLEYERDNKVSKRKNYETHIQKYKDKIEKVRELYKFFNMYREKMEMAGYIDYDDMINFILEKFEVSPVFAEKISNKYDYIIIDEYQDTNKSQNELIFHLVDNSEKGNIFVVGDDKQIVNASQGARIDSIRTFWEKYKEDIKEPIKFIENRRSTQTILNVAKTVAELNNELLDKEINLIAANEEVVKKDKKVRLNVYYDEIQQASDIVNEIDDLIKSQDCPVSKETNEKDLSQIAILLTNKEEINYYAEQLHSRNIPYELKDGKSIFDIKSSVVLFSYLKTLVNPDECSDVIFRLLLMPPFNISSESFMLLRNENSRYKNFICAMREIIKSKNSPDDIKNFLSTYNNLKNTVQAGETVYRTVLQCVSKTGILDFYLNFDINKTENLLALKKLLDEAYLFSSQYKQVNLEDFVAYLDMCQNDGISLNVEKDSDKMNAVQLTTFQSSKGLEYEYVYMPSLKPRKWESSPRPIIQPPIPLSADDQRDSDTWDSFKLADKINKMYVGMTRAKHTLRLSYVGTEGSEGHSKLLRVDEIPSEYLTINNYCNEKWDTHIQNIMSNLSTEDFDYRREFDSVIDSVVSKFEYYSPTLINPYIKCPRMFFFDKVLKLSSPNFDIPDALNFGSAIHKACEDAVNEAKKPEGFWDPEKFVEYTKMQIDVYPFSSFKQREQYKSIAETSIKEFYVRELSLINPKNIYNIEDDIILDFEGVKFKGFPDRVDLIDGKFRIYDYKTGRAKSKSEICFTSPDDEKLGSHEDYYIQMGLYKYFLEKSDKEGRKVEKTVFLFPQEWKKPCEVEYSDNDIEKVLDKYRYAINGIKSKNFEPTPSKVSCANCPYKSDICNFGC